MTDKRRLTDIPGEVLFDHLFPFLKLNDLLRLRRVCKFTKPLAEDYLRLHVISKTFVYVGLGSMTEKSFSSIITSDLKVPVSKVVILNQGNKCLEEKQLHQFLEIYGSQITHLRLTRMEAPITTRKVLRFFELLPNLEDLEFDDFITNIRKSSSDDRKQKKRRRLSENQSSLFPACLKRLRSLCIHYYKCEDTMESVGLLCRLINECSANLEYLKNPKPFDVSNYIQRHLLGGVSDFIITLVNESFLQNLKFFDISYLYKDLMTHPNFYRLVNVCTTHNVKLLGVDANLIEEIMTLYTWDEDLGTKISSVVVSLRNLQPSCFLLEFPHLEKISGVMTCHSEYCSMPDWEYERQAWPNLKELEFVVNSEFLEDDEDRGRTSELLDFFFRKIRRDKMEVLEMTFSKDPNIDEMLPQPKARQICASCPNLKYLKLKGWHGKNKTISKLWRGLPLLEEVEFESCGSLRDSAFLGRDKNKSALLQARNLRTLKISGFEKMRKITDALFTQVLRHMPLKELQLGSSQLTEGCEYTRCTITPSGLASLLDGVFSETVEKLSLDIENADLSVDVKEALLKRFRSSKMM